MPSHNANETAEAPSFKQIEEKFLSPSTILSAAILSIVFYFSIAFVITHSPIYAAVDYATNGPAPPDPNANSIVRPKVIFKVSPATAKSDRVLNLTVSVLPVASGPKPTGTIRFLIAYDTLTTGKLTDGAITVRANIPARRSQAPLRALYLGDDYYSTSFSDTETPIINKPH